MVVDAAGALVPASFLQGNAAMDTQSPFSRRTGPGFREAVTDAKASMQRSLEQCDAAVRERPRRSLLAAFALGSLARRLPLPQLITTGLRVVWFAAPSALAVLGAAGLVERFRRKEESNSPRNPPQAGDSPDVEPAEGGHRIILPDEFPLPAPPLAAA